MSKRHMEPHQFESLLSKINSETDSTGKKLNILFTSKGNFSAHQAARLIYAFGCPSDKTRVIEILEPRLCVMSCSEARDIIGAVGIHNDKVLTLNYVKRYLLDSQTREGAEFILSAFPFEPDKSRAINVLRTVRSDVRDAMPAGGHQGYTALGGLYTQCPPLETHLYGTVAQQDRGRPGQGKIEIPTLAQPGVVPSMYTGHPSYAYPPGKDYISNLPGTMPFMEHVPVPSTYPSGGPPLGFHSGAPAPTGFPTLVETSY